MNITLDAELKNRLVASVHAAMRKANEKLNRDFEMPLVLFDVRGTCGGKASPSRNVVRINLGIARDNEVEYTAQTIPHEVSHIVAVKFYCVKAGHNREWKWVMTDVFGLDPLRCHSYDVSAHRVRRTKMYIYSCNCESHVYAGAKHHRMIQEGRVMSCKVCKVRITPANLIKVIDRHPANAV